MQKEIKSFDNIIINYDYIKTNDNSSFLIFLHGAGGDLAAWNKEREMLHRKGISTIAIDLRGHGKSGRPEKIEDYELYKFAKDVYEVISKEKIKEFILVGHCFGGIVSIMFHKQYPRLANAYILIDTTYVGPHSLKLMINNTFVKYAAKLIFKDKDKLKKQFVHADHEKFIGTTDYDLKRIYSDIRHTSLRSWLFTYQQITTFDGIKILETISQPVLIIQGEKDKVFNLKISRKIHESVNRSELKIIPDSNHILVINNPEAVEKEIYDFVQKRKGFIK